MSGDTMEFDTMLMQIQHDLQSHIYVELDISVGQFHGVEHMVFNIVEFDF